MDVKWATGRFGPFLSVFKATPDGLFYLFHVEWFFQIAARLIADGLH